MGITAAHPIPSTTSAPFTELHSSLPRIPCHSKFSFSSHLLSFCDLYDPHLCLKTCALCILSVHELVYRNRAVLLCCTVRWCQASAQADVTQSIKSRKKDAFVVSNNGDAQVRAAHGNGEGRFMRQV